MYASALQFWMRQFLDLLDLLGGDHVDEEHGERVALNNLHFSRRQSEEWSIFLVVAEQKSQRFWWLKIDLIENIPSKLTTMLSPRHNASYASLSLSLPPGRTLTIGGNCAVFGFSFLPIMVVVYHSMLPAASSLSGSANYSWKLVSLIKLPSFKMRRAMWSARFMFPCS